MSGSIICMSFQPPCFLWEYFDYCICINFQCGGPLLRYIYLETGVQLILYVCLPVFLSVYMYVYLYIFLSLCLVIQVDFLQ